MSILFIVATTVGMSVAEYLRRNSDGSWPEEPDSLTGTDALTLATIDFTSPLAAFYQTTALAL